MKKTNNLIPLALNIQLFSALFYCLLARSPDDPQRIRVASVFEFSVGQLPRVSTEDRVVSVFEPSVCLFSANFLICYSTVQYSTV